MPQLLANNANALLVGAITAVSTSLTVEAARADLFPVGNTTNFVAPADWFKVTLEDVLGNVEIVYVGVRTAASGVMSTLLRGQEGTTARAFAAGSVVEQRATRADLQAGANAVARTGGAAFAMLGQLILAGNASAVLDAVPKQQLDAAVASLAAVTAALQAQVTAGGTGSVAGGVFYENKPNLLIDYTLTTGNSAHLVGPLTVATAKTLTIPTGAQLVVL